MAKTNFNGNKVVIAGSKSIALHSPVLDCTNFLYDIYFTSITADENGSVSQSRFNAWRYPSTVSGDSCYIKDIKTGIFVDGFNGELVVTAAMDTTNGHPGTHSGVNYNTKSASARLRFWALFTDTYGNIHCHMLDSVVN